MRCLLCRNEVSLLQKLSDAQFCSSEHRQRFCDEQQQLMLDRLLAAALPLDRFSLFGQNRGRRAEPEPVPEAVAPADLAALLATRVDPRNVAFLLRWFAPFEATQVQLLPPAYGHGVIAKAELFGGGICDIPVPHYNAGLWSFGIFAPTALGLDDLLHRVDERRRRPLGRFALGRAGRRKAPGVLIPVEPPVHPCRFLLSDPLPPAAGPAPAALRLTIACARRDLRLVRPFALCAPEAIAPAITDSIPVQLELIAVDFTPLWPPDLRAAAGRGIAFLDRMYRVRPRGAVSSPRRAPDLAVTPFAFTGAAGVLVSAPRLHAGGTTPAWTLRHSPLAVEVATRIAMADRPAAPAPASLLDAAIFTPRPLLPHRLDTEREAPGLRPGLRLFRTRPRSAVADDRLSLPEAGAWIETMASGPALPASGLTGCAPAPVVRMYRGRPRGPVDSTVPVMERSACAPAGAPAEPVFASGSSGASGMGVRLPRQAGCAELPLKAAAAECTGAQPAAAAPEAFSSSPITVELRAGAGDLTPADLHELVALPVQAADTRFPAPCVEAGLANAFASAAVPKPALRPVPPAAEPRLVTRMYRGRPRAGVPASTLSGTEPEADILAAPIAAVPAFPQIGLSEPEPQRAERFFRPRPKAAGSATLLDARDAGASAMLLSPPVAMGVPATAGTLEPALVTRMFRPRPRSGVDRGPHVEVARVSAVECAARPEVAGGSTSLATPPALGKAALSGAARPIEASAGGATFVSGDVAILVAVPLPEFTYHATLDCAPPQLERLFRGRPRLAERRAMPSTAGVQPLGGYETATPSMLFLLNASGDPAPPFLNRLFRPRPRTAADDASTLQAPLRFRHLPFAEPEAVRPALGLAILEEPAPAMLEKLYKMRPKSGKSGAATSLPIVCEPSSGPAAVAASAAGGLGMDAAKEALLSLTRNWHAAPRAIKTMVMAVPIVFAVAMYPFTATSGAASQSASSSSAPAAIEKTVADIGEGLRSRAAIEIAGEFTGELDSWTGAGNWRQTWKPHASGWISPGQIALFTPSALMTDYSVEFAGQIVKGGLSFGVRAADEKNFFGVRLARLSNGPVGSLKIVRGAVVDGKPAGVTETPIPIAAARDAVFRIKLTVSGQDFTLMLGDKVVDFWSDARSKGGAVAFFAAKGEKSLIQNVRVTHQNDAVGKFVAAALPAQR